MMNQIPVHTTLLPKESLSEHISRFPATNILHQDFSYTQHFSEVLKSQISDKPPAFREITKSNQQNDHHKAEINHDAYQQATSNAKQEEKQPEASDNEAPSISERKLKQNEQEEKPEKIASTSEEEKKTETRQEDETDIPEELQQIEKKLETLVEDLENGHTCTPHEMIAMLKNMLEEINQQGDTLFELDGIKEDLTKKLKELLSLLEKKVQKSLISSFKDSVSEKGNKQLAHELKNIKKEISRLIKKITVHDSKKHLHAPTVEHHRPEQVLQPEKSNQLFTSINADEPQAGKNDTSDNSFQFSKGSQFSRNSQVQGKTAFHDLQHKPGLFKEQLQEVINKARIVIKNANNGNLSLKLYPEHLGKVNVNLGLENGTIHAKFIVDSDEAKAALSESLELLREKLEDEGLSIGNFQVNVQDNRGRFAQAEQEPEFFLTGELEHATLQASNEYDIQSYTHNGNIDVVI
jgi:flagellar hook-length control protein FliK